MDIISYIQKDENIKKYFNNKNKKKITDDMFKIPNVDTIDNFMRYNYNVKQLKKICKFYKQKTSGNKNDLLRRIISYLHLYKYACLIQKNWRMFIVKKYLKLKGPGFLNRSVCVNNTDFFLLDDLKEIPSKEFISFKEKDGFIYGFNIFSLYTLIKQGGEIQNPYTRTILDTTIKNNVNEYIRLSNILSIPLNLKIENTDTYLSEDQIFKMRVEKLFKFMDDMGNYTNSKWFMDLSCSRLYRYVCEIEDLWNYRLQLTREMKGLICPPYGNPFYNVNMHSFARDTRERNLMKVRKVALQIIENLCYNSVNDEHKQLGIIYCLTIFTMVNADAWEAMPWLYESTL